MKFCTNCGAKMETHMAFCTDCGTQARRPPVHQTTTTPVRQIQVKPMYHAGTNHFARKNTNYIIIAIVAIVTLIGFVLFINQSDNTGLVGTWEARERTWRGEVQWLITFNRNGTGSSVILLNDVLDRQDSFSWEVINDRQLLFALRDSAQRPEILEFSVTRTTLILEGDVFTRR